MLFRSCRLDDSTTDYLCLCVKLVEYIGDFVGIGIVPYWWIQIRMKCSYTVIHELMFTKISTSLIQFSIPIIFEHPSDFLRLHHTFVVECLGTFYFSGCHVCWQAFGYFGASVLSSPRFNLFLIEWPKPDFIRKRLMHKIEVESKKRNIVAVFFWCARWVED